MLARVVRGWLRTWLLSVRSLLLASARLQRPVVSFDGQHLLWSVPSRDLAVRWSASRVVQLYSSNSVRFLHQRPSRVQLLSQLRRSVSVRSVSAVSDPVWSACGQPRAMTLYLYQYLVMLARSLAQRLRGAGV